jgi:hypothetical protein
VPAEQLQEAFASAGGRRVRTEELDLSWRFPSRPAASDFCRELFGLRPETTDAEIGEALADLGLNGEGDSARLPWRMIFVSAER